MGLSWIRKIFIDDFPEQWTQYLVCLLIHLTWPIAPLLFEKLLTDKVPLTSITLVAFMYAIAIGITSQRVLQLFIAIAEVVCLAVFYGSALQMHDNLDASKSVHVHGLKESFMWWVAASGMLLIYIMHAAERYDRHVQKLDPFLEFTKSTPSGKRTEGGQENE